MIRWLPLYLAILGWVYCARGMYRASRRAHEQTARLTVLWAELSGMRAMRLQVTVDHRLVLDTSIEQARAVRIYSGHAPLAGERLFTPFPLFAPGTAVTVSDGAGTYSAVPIDLRLIGLPVEASLPADSVPLADLLQPVETGG